MNYACRYHITFHKLELLNYKLLSCFNRSLWNIYVINSVLIKTSYTVFSWSKIHSYHSGQNIFIYIGFIRSLKKFILPLFVINGNYIQDINMVFSSTTFFLCNFANYGNMSGIDKNKLFKILVQFYQNIFSWSIFLKIGA